MDLGFEAAKGAAEKVTGIKLPVWMRMVLPGLLVTGVLYRTTAWALHYLPGDPDHAWLRLVAYAALVLVSGALVSTLNSEVYKIYEGRIFWPRRLFDWGKARQQARVTKLLARANAARSQAEYDEIWYQLRIYPTDDKADPQATHPTRIGNILAGYEQYPTTRYNMDSVFYWPRIWLQLEKEKKEEIDSQWSLADGFLTLSAVSILGGLSWIAQALIATVSGFGRSAVPTGSLWVAPVAGLALIALGYLWYRLSLPFHRENGEVFKSIFDIYRSKVWDMTSLKPHEKQAWYAAWAYLQYQLIICPNCGQATGVQSDTCQNCGFGLKEAKRNLDSSGTLPTPSKES